MLTPLITLRFGEESGICGATAFMSEDAELTEVHIKVIVTARQMTMEWQLTEDSEYVKGWNPSKYF